MDRTGERTQWRTASYSGSNGGACIEVGQAPGIVAVRDSKDRQGPALDFSPGAWREFAESIKER